MKHTSLDQIADVAPFMQIPFPRSRAVIGFRGGKIA
jgi:hypothetical protein